MDLNSLSMRKRVLTLLTVVVVGAVVWVIQAGYLPEIGKFFASEPGYIPSCAWHGEQKTSVQSCCSNFVAVPAQKIIGLRPPADDIRLPVEETSGTGEVEPTATVAPTLEYCVLPECQAVLRDVQCIQSPCEPVVEIMCPDGVIPPPRPTDTPTPAPIPKLYVYNLTDPTRDQNFAIGDSFRIAVSGTPNTALASCWTFNGNTECDMGPYITSSDPSGEWHLDGEALGTAIGNWKRWVVIDGQPSNYVSYTVGAPIFPTPTPYSSYSPTPASSPGTRPAALNVDQGGATGSQAVGRYFYVPIKIDTGGLSVSAVKLQVDLDGPGSIVGVTYGDAFPAILQSPIYSQNIVALTLGSGTSGGKSGNNLLVTNVTVLVAESAAVGDVIRLSISPLSEVSASGYTSSVLGNVGSGGFTVQSVATKPGDANGDGKIDIFDYNLVITNFGRIGANIPGDVNGDGKVDIFDYNLVITNFGN